MPFDKLTEYLDSLSKTQNVPGCDCVVLHHHDTVYRHSAGFADQDRTRPVSGNDLYYMFSATKLFTCTAVMQLVERGLLDLDDEVSKYLPEFKSMRVLCETPKMPLMSLPEDAPTRPAKRQILISDLLSMTSGLTYDLDTTPIKNAKVSYNGKATTRQMISAIAASPLACDPGEHWIYSLSHDVLAGVVEVVSGKTFGEYLSENIFSPLGMKDSYFHLSSAQMARLSQLYSIPFGGGDVSAVEPVNRFCLSDCYESGGAGLVMTVGDYALFLDAMICGGVSAGGKKILNRETIDLMRKNRLDGQLLEDFKGTGKVGYGYGLGVRTLIDPSASHSGVGEFGWDGAAGAYVLIDPDNEIGIFYAEHILGHIDSYFKIHPAIRDMVYDELTAR